MATQVTNYQCPACTGPLHFEASSGKLECEFCGSAYEIAQIEAMYMEKEAQAAQAQAAAEEPCKSGADEWDLSGLSDSWGADADSMRVYSCPSCCAELICDETTAATACPYCGNPTVVPGQFSGVLKPDYVLPFKLKKEDAIAALKKHYEGRPFLPSVFKKENHLEQIKGVYVPFWLFDGEAQGDILYAATRTYTSIERDYEVTRTEHYNVRRAGTVAFSNIPVDGSTKMPDDYMDSIEPFDYEALKPFSTAYLPGFLADKYDVSAAESCRRADERAANTVKAALANSVTGYTGVFERGENLTLHRGAVKYALLPVWLLNTRWKGENYLFAMNGQTGKLVGHLPVDKGKKWRIFAAVYGAAALVTAAVMLFPGGLLNLLGM